MTEKLSSTGRTPALSPTQVRTMLERYFGEDKPSMKELAAEFPQTSKSTGEVRPMSLATVRKYLKAAGVTLPRGRAGDLDRTAPASVRTMMNRIPTEILIGKGRAELLVRLLERGASQASMVKEFGVSKDRVSRLRKRVLSVSEETPEEAETSEETPEEVEERPAVPEPEENILDNLDELDNDAPTYEEA